MINVVNLHFEDQRDRQEGYATEHIQIMRIRMAPGEALPHHKSNSNVLLLPVAGTIRLEAAGETATASVGEAISVPYDTPMDVSNAAEGQTILLVLKTPHPKAFV